MKGYPKFKALLVERGIKQKDVAKLLGVTVTTFNNKLNGVSDFSVTEAVSICSSLRIKAGIFFADRVPYSERSKSA